jgi:16S rRNA U1498 N3-methylase RsmE
MLAMFSIISPIQKTQMKRFHQTNIHRACSQHGISSIYKIKQITKLRESNSPLSGTNLTLGLDTHNPGNNECFKQTKKTTSSLDLENK